MRLGMGTSLGVGYEPSLPSRLVDASASCLDYHACRTRIQPRLFCFCNYGFGFISTQLSMLKEFLGEGVYHGPVKSLSYEVGEGCKPSRCA